MKQFRAISNVFFKSNLENRIAGSIISRYYNLKIYLFI